MKNGPDNDTKRERIELEEKFGPFWIKQKRKTNKVKYYLLRQAFDISWAFQYR